MLYILGTGLPREVSDLNVNVFIHVKSRSVHVNTTHQSQRGFNKNTQILPNYHVHKKLRKEDA